MSECKCGNSNKNCELKAILENYEKDKSKIEGYKNPLIRTAKIQSCVIKGLVSDWNSI